MINKEKLQSIIVEYKKFFYERWEKGEKFKWKAIQQFQTYWDINAEDFEAMWNQATRKTYSLLDARSFFPKRMMNAFIEREPETVREMFLHLFDEKKDLEERINNFRLNAEILREKYGNGVWYNHYQTVNSISTYLWLRYPDKYYIYKYSEYQIVAKELQSEFVPKRTGGIQSMLGGFHMYDEICEQLQEDSQLKYMLERVLTDEYYSDPMFKTLTFDLGFFISRFYSHKEIVLRDEWWPLDYKLEFTVDDWTAMLNDRELFDTNCLKVMKRFKDYGGEATCVQLAEKYGGSYNFYNKCASALAKRIADKTGCNVMDRGGESSRWWPILFIGRDAIKGERGRWVWRLRNELSEALDKMDLSEIKLYEDEADEDVQRNYWWLNANPKIWSFSNLAVGETQSYTLYNDNGNKRRIFQNFLDAKAGDIVIGYESHPVKQIVALAKVVQDQDGENLYFEKTESLTMPISYTDLKNCPELEDMEYFVQPQGSLFKLTKEEYDFIMDIIREGNPVKRVQETIVSYTREKFLSEVYMSSENLDTLISLLKRKKNVILCGAPGVGKTFTAKRLAYAMMGVKDDSRIGFIQFHQNYSYEDFVLGYRPKENGFGLEKGLFYRFVEQAKDHPNKDYFFIIDEINRGNMSKIFGELLMAVEKQYRGTEDALSYDGRSFSVPDNLYIIGMMNTADRSLAMIDYALRRRFSFFEMEPGFDSEGFKAYQEKFANETFDILIDKIKELNRDIRRDDSLGEGFCIGHSYFCGEDECTEQWLQEVVYYDILPTLQEYWFDNKAKVQQWENRLSGVFND